MRRPAIARANFYAGEGGDLVVFAFQKPQTLSLRRSISLLYMPRRGEVFILAKRGAIGLSRFQPRRPLYFGGGERQSCQASHLPLVRQDDCRNLAPLERRHLDSGRKAAVLSVFGECKFFMPPERRGIFFPSARPAREAFFPSPAAFPRPCAPRLLPALKYARWACLLGKNRI